MTNSSRFQTRISSRMAGTPGVKTRFALLPGHYETGYLLSALPLPCEACDIGRCRVADRRWRARKPRRWRGLGDAVAGDEGLSRRHVRMLGRLLHGQNRRETDVGAFHDLAPLIPRLGLEDVDQSLLERGPRFAIHLGVEVGVRKAGQIAQQRVELRLDRADRNEALT